MQFTNITTKINDFFSSSTGKLISKWTQRIIALSVLAWLVLELSEIGWGNVWKSLPTEPLFYFFFLLFFLQLPIFEAYAYKITWPLDIIKAFPAFLQKRVYNKEVFGYSGEVFILFWAKNYLGISGKQAFKTVKDNNIISSLASTIFSVVLLSIFIFTSQIKILDWFFEKSAVYYVSIAVAGTALIILLYRFRKLIVSMSLKNSLKVFSIHTVRLVFVQVLNLLMYYVVLPEIELYTWFIYIALEIIISRVPFIPNRDVIYTSMSIIVAASVPVSEAEIAGIMLARLTLNKLGSFLSFLYAKWASKSIKLELEENQFT